MAVGSWEDFTSKFGFNDGESVEDRDFRARRCLVKLLNALPEFEVIRAIEYDRGGAHNPCMIILLPNPNGKGDKTLLKDWFDKKIKECDLPDGDGETYDTWELVAKAYAEVR